MLKIRPQQLAAFERQAEAAFVSRTLEYLREQHHSQSVRLPDTTSNLKDIPTEKLQLLVSAQIARGRSYGMSWESNLTAFVVLSFITAPNFDAHPLVSRVLKDDKVAPDERR